ncbi:MAG: glycosyltransferase [Myxococcales bacterium]|nr:glycosyltransferase [Myxococcales bacterium]
MGKGSSRAADSNPAGSNEQSNESGQRPVDASIVIRCYNEEKHIGKLLHGIVSQDFPGRFEIVVVDSGSTDDTVPIAQQFPVKLITIRPEQFSFGRALNLGCAESAGEFLVFVSAHVYPLFDDWLSLLLAPFENERIGAVYGKQRGGPETKFSEHQVFSQWFPDKSVAVQETPFSNNANCAVRRSLWNTFPYDEELTGLEDLAWAKEIMAAGYRVSYAADAVIAHIHEESPAQIKNRYMREAIALKQIFPEQEMSVWDFCTLFARNTVSDYVHAARDGVVKENILEIPQFRLMQFWGAFSDFARVDPCPNG